MNRADSPTAAGLPADVRGGLRWLSGLALVSCVFLVAPAGYAYRWIDMSAVSSTVAVLAGLLGLAAAGRHRRGLAVAAGVLCLTAAAVRLVSLTLHTSAPIGGSASTLAFLAGLGLGYLLIGLADRLPGWSPTT